MRAESFLCLGGLEISNAARTAAYVNHYGVPNVIMSQTCPCFAIDDGYVDIDSDPAPWHEVTRPESNDFFGFYADDIQLSSVFGRSVGAAGRRGSSVGPLGAKGRIVTVTGTVWARSAEGMAYGERWLSEAVRGKACEDGNCPTDDLLILPACPELASYDSDRYFRTLVNVGLVEGPNFSKIVNAERYLQEVTMVFVSTQPYLYHPRQRLIDDGVVSGSYGAPLAAKFTTPEWTGEGTFVIEVRNTDVADVEDLTITGQISLDGSCPVSGTASSVPPSFVYEIPVLAPEDRLIIDGRRRQVTLHDASEKTSSPGLGSIDFTGPWTWPDVPPCTTMCVSMEPVVGEIGVTVDAYLREF